MILYADPETYVHMHQHLNLSGTDQITHLELSWPVANHHVVPLVDSTLPDAESFSDCTCDQLGSVSTREQQTGEKNGEIRVSHVLREVISARPDMHNGSVHGKPCLLLTAAG